MSYREVHTHLPRRHNRQVCGTHKLMPRRKPTATRTASSSKRRPQAAIGKACSQSPLRGEAAARNLARSSLFPKPASTIARSCKTPGLLYVLFIIMIVQCGPTSQHDKLLTPLLTRVVHQRVRDRRTNERTKRMTSPSRKALALRRKCLINTFTV